MTDPWLSMPIPQDKQPLQRFLGVVGYVGKFIPDLAEVSKPLQLDLEKNIAWQVDQIEAYDKLKY